MFTSDNKIPVLQNNPKIPKRKTLVRNEIENKTNEIYNLSKYVQSLITEVGATNYFWKNSFIHLKIQSRNLRVILTWLKIPLL